MYVYAFYGHKTGSYVPIYYTQGDIERFFKNAGHDGLKFYRHKDLTFGTLVHNLPISLNEQ